VADTPLRFQTARRVEFVDTDAAGIVHFSAFFLYMEQAEHAFLRHHGLAVFLRDNEGEISWPRVSATCDYLKPAKFEDELQIEVTVERIGAKSVTYLHRVTCEGQELAIGKMTAVCCRVSSTHPPRPIEIPERIRRILSGEAGE
jgi:4-hydroxybenzoyl-CoA thioesterase/acyl-CoA thioester hydrolase